MTLNQTNHRIKHCHVNQNGYVFISFPKSLLIYILLALHSQNFLSQPSLSLPPPSPALAKITGNTSMVGLSPIWFGLCPFKSKEFSWLHSPGWVSTSQPSWAGFLTRQTVSIYSKTHLWPHQYNLFLKLWLVFYRW